MDTFFSGLIMFDSFHFKHAQVCTSDESHENRKYLKCII